MKYLTSPNDARHLARNDAGMSLVEVAFAVGILAFALVAVLGVLMQGHEANVLNRSRVLAFDEARAVIDGLRSLKDTGAVVPDELMKRFPEGKMMLPEGILENAWRTIEYDAKSLPLTVNVTVHWLDLRGREASVQLSTAIGRN
jgi:type II secretory pathway pseudopilin PulG